MDAEVLVTSWSCSSFKRISLKSILRHYTTFTARSCQRKSLVMCVGCYRHVYSYSVAGLEAEGLYRVAGLHDEVEEIRMAFDKGINV